MSAFPFGSPDAAVLAWLDRETKFSDAMVLIFSDISMLLSTSEAPADDLRAEAERVRNSVEADTIEDDVCPVVWRRAQLARIGWCYRLARRLEDDLGSGKSAPQAIEDLLAKLACAQSGILAALIASKAAILSA